MRRAMETAYTLFASHENFQNIQFVLVPEIRERMFGYCDIPGPLTETLTYAKQAFPKLDSSRLHSDTWAAEVLFDKNRSDLLDFVSSKSQEMSVANATVTFMQDHDSY